MKWTYDKQSDVMYITFGDPLPCRTVECEGVCIRQHGSTLNGITIVDYSRKTHDSGAGEHISQQPQPKSVPSLCLDCIGIRGCNHDTKSRLCKYT